MNKMTQLLKNSAAIVALLITVSLFSLSCQEDKVIVQNPPPEQSIEPGSDLVNLMRNVSENDVSVDNIIDGTDCSSIQFPFTVIAGGIEVTIDSIEDLFIIQQLIDDNQGNGNIEILFPITIILPDYTTIVIESQEEFDLFIASCDPSPNECVDFVYPISFSVFNLEFELIETVVIANDFELFFFLQDLDDNNGNIVSLNFPVSLVYGNGNSIEVSTNAELAAAIEAGPDNCEVIVDPENPCPAAVVEAYLLECFWYPSSYDGVTDNAYEYYHFTFSENSNLEMTTSNAYNIDALWSVTEVDGKTIVLLEAVFPIFEPFLGNWEVLECSEEQLLLEREDGVQMVFSRDCDYDLAQCTGSGLGICDTDGDGFVSVDFNEIIDLHFTCNDALEYSITFHETYADANALQNQLPSPYQTTVPNSQTLFYAITEVGSQEVRYVASFQIDAEDCGTNCDNPGVLTDGLIVYMPFGSEIHELVSDEILGIGGQFVEDRAGNDSCAIGFSQGDDPIFIPGTPENEITGDFAISLWFKMQNDAAGDYEIIFSTQQHQSDGLELGVYDLNTPLFVTHNPEINLWDNDWNQEVDVVWTNTDWHHLLITHEGDVTRMYRDGILRNETNEDVNLGGATDTGYMINAQNFRGHVDDLRVYNRALSPNEVFVLFNLEADCYTCLE